jgi:hypothetical protein
MEREGTEAAVLGEGEVAAGGSPIRMEFKNTSAGILPLAGGEAGPPVKIRMPEGRAKISFLVFFLVEEGFFWL